MNWEGEEKYGKGDRMHTDISTFSVSIILNANKEITMNEPIE